MARLVPLVLLLAACSGKDADSSFTTPGPGVTSTGGLTTTGSTTTGTPGGTPGGTPAGTTTTTTTPPTDFCPPWPAATGTVVTAAAGSDLQAAIDGLSTGDTLAIEAGTWQLASPLLITTPGITVRSASGTRADVVLDGNQAADAVFHVRASDVSLVSLTVRNAFNDGVAVLPDGADLTGVQLYDLEIVDNAQYGVLIETDATQFFADQGTIACSHIELTDAGRPNVRNACRTAGIDGHRAQGWTVRDTWVGGFWCPAGSAHAGIRFWRGSRDTRIERTEVKDSRRGILLGQGSDQIVRVYQDQPCGGIFTQHYGGQLHNNLVWTDDNDLDASLSGVVDGISVESACEVEVLHNTVRVEGPSEGSIIHRYANTSGILANNLVADTVRRLDGSTAVSNSNVENAQDYNWVSVPNGDFHIAPGATDPIDAGDAQWLVAVPEDVDGHDRSPAPDAGWDERL